MLKEYDLVILGGGATAFAAITEASRMDLTTSMVNAGLPLGGTCVNVGCVPSKHFLEVGKTVFEPPRNPFEAVRYGEDEPRIDWETAIEEKDRLVERLRRQNYVDVAEHFETGVYEGFGRFIGDTIVKIVDGPAEGTCITGQKALIATGSSPHNAPIDGLDEVNVETSETILERAELPRSILIIGGGYVAHRMGADSPRGRRRNDPPAFWSSALQHGRAAWPGDTAMFPRGRNHSRHRERFPARPCG